MMRRNSWFAALILLIAVAFRLNQLSYGLNNVCLTVAEEYWLYDQDQPVSLYTWNTVPLGIVDVSVGEVDTPPEQVRPSPLITGETDPLDRFLLRLSGVALGLITLAVTIRLGKGWRANWWWLAGLLVAVTPWFVVADRWTMRFDTASFAIAVSALALWKIYRLPSGQQRDRAIVIQTVAALSLLVIAPPLWWLSIGLVLIQPYPRWRWTAFIFFAGVVLIPGLQTPELWLAATQDWDVSVTAACIFVGLVLALWRFRDLSNVQQSILFAAIVLAGGIILYRDSQLENPDSNEWQLIDWLQTRIPDDSAVRFDGATWQLASIVACPVGANLRFEAQSMVVQFFDVRDLAKPYYFVSAEPDTRTEMPYLSEIAGQYWVGRNLELNHPVDIGFRDLVYLLGYEVLTPTAHPSGVVDIRIDYQFGANITPEVLAYAAFIHITPTTDPTTNWSNYSDPFFEESGNTGSRRVMLNHHIRFSLPPEIPAGSYDVRYGIFNQYTGEQVGDTVILGEIIVE